MTTTHQRKGPEHEKATVNERVDRNIFSMKGLNIFNTFAFFNRTVQESLLLQNKRVNQDKGKHDIQKAETPTQDKDEENSQDVGVQQKNKKLIDLHVLERFMSFLDSVG